MLYNWLYWAVCIIGWCHCHCKISRSKTCFKGNIAVLFKALLTLHHPNIWLMFRRRAASNSKLMGIPPLSFLCCNLKLWKTFFIFLYLLYFLHHRLLIFWSLTNVERKRAAALHKKIDGWVRGRFTFIQRSNTSSLLHIVWYSMVLTMV